LGVVFFFFGRGGKEIGVVFLGLWFDEKGPGGGGVRCFCVFDSNFLIHTWLSFFRYNSFSTIFLYYWLIIHFGDGLSLVGSLFFIYVCVDSTV